MYHNLQTHHVLRLFLSGRSRAVQSVHLVANIRAFSARHSVSTWQPVAQLDAPPSIETFRQQALHGGKPVKLAPGSIPIDVHGTWLTTGPSPSSSSPSPTAPPSTTLNTAYLRQFASTVYLPMELSMPDQTDIFHRSEAAPLSLFLDAWDVLSSNHDTDAEADTDPRQPSSTTPRIYIAQSPLSLLPAPLAAAFGDPSTAPDLVARAGAGDVYGSSLWLGAAPTATPLHRDPNPNVLAQLAGRKHVRLLAPERGAAVYADVMARIDDARSAGGARRDDGEGGGGGGGFGASERFRGEGMMKGRERDELERAVWDGEGGDGGTEGQLAFEAVLGPGDALFIPLGWWHAVRGVGQGVNMSVNWWFR